MVSILLVWMTGSAMAANLSDEQQKLYPAAKAEGKVVLYTSAASKEVQEMMKIFESKYPGIKTEFYRAGSGTVMEKLLSEHEAGIYTADVMLFHATMGWVDMKKRGMLMKYESPVYDEIPAKGQDRGYTIAGRTLGTFMTYNTNLLPKEVAMKQKTLEDWVNLAEQEKYRGRFGTQDLSTGGGIESVYTFFLHHGEEKAKSLYQRLFAAGMRMNKGGAGQLNAVASGQEAFSFLVPGQRLKTAQDKGAPIDYTVLEDGQPIFLSPMSIYAKAPNPNAAKLLFNWLASEEGQSLIVSVTGNYSIRPELPAPEGFPRRSEINVIQAPITKWEDMGNKTEEIISFVDKNRNQ